MYSYPTSRRSIWFDFAFFQFLPCTSNCALRNTVFADPPLSDLRLCFMEELGEKALCRASCFLGVAAAPHPQACNTKEAFPTLHTFISNLSCEHSLSIMENFLESTAPGILFVYVSSHSAFNNL